MPMTTEELGKLPVDAALPAGRDVRYEPDMEALKDEVDKLNDPASTTSVDWRKIDALARKILQEQSKDLTAACYLAVALAHEQGIPGMHEGLSLIAALSENFWDTMYPSKKRMHGRKLAIEWWADKCSAWLKTPGIPEQKKEDVESITGELDALDDFLAGAMDDQPFLRELQNVVRVLPVKSEGGEETDSQPSGKEGPGRSPSGVSTGDSPVSVSPSPVPGDDESAQKALAAAMQSLEQIAGYHFSKNAFSPFAFRLSRIAAWSTVESLPPATEGKTRIPPPPKQLVQSLQGNMESENWDALLKTAEMRVHDFLFWFDLSFYSAKALEQLQKPEALEELERQSAGYARRLKGIEKLCFADGTLFVSEQAGQWLKKITDRYSGAHVPASFSGSRGDSMVRKDIAQAVEKAREFRKSGREGEALVLLQQGVDGSRSKREELLRRSGLTGFLVEIGRQKIALRHLEKVVRDIDDFRLDILDPDMAIELLSAVYNGFLSQDDQDSHRRAENIMARIAEISPVKALQMEL